MVDYSGVKLISGIKSKYAVERMYSALPMSPDRRRMTRISSNFRIRKRKSALQGSTQLLVVEGTDQAVLFTRAHRYRSRHCRWLVVQGTDQAVLFTDHACSSLSFASFCEIDFYEMLPL